MKLILVKLISLVTLCHGYLKIDQLEAIANEKYNKVNVTLDNSDPEKSVMNFFSQLTTDKDIVRAKILIVLKSSSDAKSEKLFQCNTDLLKTKVDVCKMGNIQSTTFAKVLMENFAHNSDFELKCPMKPKNYSLTNFSITDTYLLRFPKEQKLCLDFTLSGSLKNKGKLEPLMQIKAWIRFKKEM